MKKTLLTLGIIGLVCGLLIFRLFFTQNSRMTEEREWFAKSLGYEFSARVDSVRMLNSNMGRLWCLLEQGNPQIEREDSLKRLFKEHDKLYFIFKRSEDTITFLVPYAHLVKVGDRVRVSSKEDKIQFFRDQQQVVADDLSSTLTGFGTPFFLKKRR